jgi:hypothetical protein
MHCAKEQATCAQKYKGLFIESTEEHHIMMVWFRSWDMNWVTPKYQTLYRYVNLAATMARSLSDILFMQVFTGRSVFTVI